MAKFFTQKIYWVFILAFMGVVMFIFPSDAFAILSLMDCQGPINSAPFYDANPSPTPQNGQFYCPGGAAGTLIDESAGIVYQCSEGPNQDTDPENMKCVRYNNPADYFVCTYLGNLVTQSGAPVSGWLYADCAPGSLIDVTPPDPVTVTLTPRSPTQIDVVWTQSNDNIGVTSYGISTCSGISCVPNNFVPNILVPVSPRLYFHTGLLPGTWYRYRVFAFDAAGNRSGSASIKSAQTFIDLTPPSVPTNLTAVASLTEAKVSLSWTASVDESTGSGLAGYKVFRDGVLIDTISVVSTYLDASVTPVTTYTYTVVAFDIALNDSAQSDPASVTTFTPVDIISPSPAPILSGNVVASDQIDLTWTASFDVDSGLAGYRVLRDGISIATLGTGVLNYSDIGISASMSYIYIVEAFDVAGNRVLSNTRSFTTLPPPDTTPPVFTFTAPSPATPLPENTTSTTLSGSTDESAVCKYSQTANQDFDTQMIVFTATGNVSHVTTISGLSAGINTFYVKCRDSAPVPNTSVAVSLSFTVTTPAPQPPIFTFTSPDPITPLPQGIGSVVLGGVTNNISFCKYSNQDVNYFDAAMTTFSTDVSGKIHSATILVMDGTSYTYYVKCQNNPSGETNTISFAVSFSVAAPANIVPAALITANKITGPAPFTVSVDGSGSFDPDNNIGPTNGIAKYTWRWGYGGSIDVTGVSAFHTYTTPGTYFITLIVEDSDGAQSNATQQIIVIPPVDLTAPGISNGAPSGMLPFGSTSATLSVRTNENASCKYDQNNTVDFSVMSGTLSTVDSRLHSTVLTGLVDGASYVYFVRCQDNASPQNTNTAGYKIAFSVGGASNTLPSVTIISATPPLGNAPLIVSVQGEAHDTDGGIITQYIWDWGDGTQTLGIADAPSGVNLSVAGASHTYTTDGTYSIVLIAIDDQNQSGVSDPEVITIIPLPDVSSPSVCSAACVTNADCGPNICGPSGICIAQGSIGSGPLRFDGSVSLLDGTNGQLVPATFSAGVRAVALHVKTDESSACRYSTVSGAVYSDSSMRQFSTGDFITHSVQIGGLQAGAYTYEVRCQSTATQEINTSSYAISFEIGVADLITGPDPHICKINENFVRNNLPHLFDICRFKTNDTTAPTAPSGLTLTISPSVTLPSVSLSWNAPGDSDGSGVSGFRIYRRSSASACAPDTTYNPVSGFCEDSSCPDCEVLPNDCLAGQTFDAISGFCLDATNIQIGIVSGTTILASDLTNIYLGQTEFTDRSVTSGAVYVYYVRAYDRAGNISLRPADKSDEKTIILP